MYTNITNIYIITLPVNGQCSQCFHREKFNKLEKRIMRVIRLLSTGKSFGLR